MTSRHTIGVFRLTFDLWLLHVTLAQGSSSTSPCSPPQAATTQCLAELTSDKQNVHVTCGSCDVRPELSCKYHKQDDTAMESVTMFNNGTNSTCAPELPRFKDLQPATARTQTVTVGCQATLALREFTDSNGGIDVLMTSCSARSTLYWPQPAVISNPTPRLLPSCIDTTKTSRKCTCYIQKHPTTVMSLTGVSRLGHSVNWTAGGQLVPGQKYNVPKAELAQADKLMHDRILMSSTIDIQAPGNEYTCVGSDGVTKVTKVFSMKEPKPHIETMDCNSTVKPGDIGSCSCYNKAAVLNYRTEIRWQICDGAKNCKDEMPPNVLRANRAFLSTVFYVAEEGVLNFRCSSRDGSQSLDVEIRVRDTAASQVAWVAYLMIPITLVTMGFLIIMNRRCVKWYIHVISLAQLPSESESEDSIDAEETDDEEGII